MPKPREWWINSYRPPGKPVEGYQEVWHDSLKEAEECEDDDKEERKDRLNERIHVREVREGEEDVLAELVAACEAFRDEDCLVWCDNRWRCHHCGAVTDDCLVTSHNEDCPLARARAAVAKAKKELSI